MTKPTHEQMMAGYAVATEFGVLERRAFDLVDAMFEALQLESRRIVIERNSLGQIESVTVQDDQGTLLSIGQ